MAEDEKLSQLLGVLYETVMAPERWPDALKLCAAYTGAVGAHLLALNKPDGHVAMSLFGGDLLSAQNTSAYADYYVHIDPRMTSNMMTDAPVHEWRPCHHYLDDRFVARNEFYQDCLIPEGGRYSMGAWVDDNSNSHTLLGLHRTPEQAPFCEQAKAAAKRFSPHLQRALRLHSHTQHLQAKAELGAQAIEALAWPFLITDGDARILHLNTRAEQLLTAHFGGLSCQFGRLHCFDPSAADELAALVRQATKHPAIGGGMRLRAVPGAGVLVAPLPAATQWARDWQKPLALVLIAENSEMLSRSKPFDLDFGDWPSIDMAKCDPVAGFAKTYQLTGRETEVLQGLTDGLSPKQIAARDDVSRNTVRTQLTSLMQKTHCHSQKDLVRLFFSFR